MSKLIELISQLNAVAKKNHDEFSYRIDIDVRGNHLSYTFVCEERADCHTFLSASAGTQDEMATRAIAKIPDACANWSYENVLP